MDKVNRAMCLAEDNAIRIAALDEKTGFEYIVGTKQKIADNAYKTVFGTFTVYGEAVVMVFSANRDSEVPLSFGSVDLVSERSPAVAELPQGTGELAAYADFKNMRAIVFGKAKKIK